MDDGRWTMDDGRWTMDDGRWTMDDGRLDPCMNSLTAGRRTKDEENYSFLDQTVYLSMLGPNGRWTIDDGR